MADKEKTPAEIALFQMQFAIQMLNVGRIETANECFQNAEKELKALIEAGQ